MARKNTTKKTVKKKGNLCRTTNLRSIRQKHGANSSKYKQIKRKCGMR